MLRFKSLGSGSSGNATLVEAQSGVHTTRLLIDCGIRLRDLEARLIEAGTCAEDLDAIFITHEHGDRYWLRTQLYQTLFNTAVDEPRHVAGCV